MASKLRIWHLLIAVGAFAALFAAVKYDSGFTPIALVMVCGLIGTIAASLRGLRLWKGLFLGLLLGPYGILIAATYRPLPTPPWRRQTDDRSLEEVIP